MPQRVISTDPSTGLDFVRTNTTISAGDIQIGSVELKNDSTDDRAQITTSNSDAASNTANALRVTSRLVSFNGTTWDRVRSGLTGAVSSVLGYLNVIPVGRYNASLPTLTDGQYINPQYDVNGRTIVTLGTAISKTTDSIEARIEGATSGAISTATTTTLKSGSGVLHKITILGGTAGAITVYDNTAGSGTVILPTFTPGSVSVAVTLFFDVAFSTGLTIVTGAATVLQVSYR